MSNGSQLSVADDNNQQGNHDFYFNGIMLAVILFISSESFHISYHQFRASKTADFVDVAIVPFLP